MMLLPGKEGTLANLASENPQARELLKSGFSIAEAVLPLTAPADIGQISLFE
jgi:hypothetical protein